MIWFNQPRKWKKSSGWLMFWTNLLMGDGRRALGWGVSKQQLRAGGESTQGTTPGQLQGDQRKVAGQSIN